MPRGWSLEIQVKGSEVEFKALEETDVEKLNVKADGELWLHKFFGVLLDFVVVGGDTKLGCVEVLHVFLSRDHGHCMRLFVPKFFAIF